MLQSLNDPKAVSGSKKLFSTRRKRGRTLSSFRNIRMRSEGADASARSNLSVYAGATMLESKQGPFTLYPCNTHVCCSRACVFICALYILCMCTNCIIQYTVYSYSTVQLFVAHFAIYYMERLARRLFSHFL